MAKVRYLSRYRLQASDPRRKHSAPFGKYYFDPDFKETVIKFRFLAEAIDHLDKEILRDTGIDLKKSRGEQ